MILYADDTVILAHSQINIARKLKALEEYCAQNGLEVHSSKTKIVIFKTGGKPKMLEKRFPRYAETSIEVVTSFNYLGVPIASSSLGLKAAQAAISNAKIASGTALSILATAKCDNWKAYVKLFDSIVVSTLLYAFPAWGAEIRRVLRISPDVIF